MHEIARRRRTQPAPPHVITEALTEPDRPGARPWLELLDDEVRPTVLGSHPPTTVVWSSIWSQRPDAVIEFDLQDDGHGGTALQWTVSLDDPPADDALISQLRKRMNVLINASLRYSFGQ